MPTDRIFIDVRTQDEFASGHVEGALNIPLPELAGSLQLNGVSKNAELVTYCNSGNRSGVAGSILQTQGFTKVTNGINAEHIQATYNQPIS